MCIQHCYAGTAEQRTKKPFLKHPPGSLQKCYEGPWDYLHRRAYEITDFYRHADLVEKRAFKQRVAAQCDFPMPRFPNGPQTFFWDNNEDEYSRYIVRVPYRHVKAGQEWHNWKSLHKWFDPSTRTWNLFIEPIPQYHTTVTSCQLSHQNTLHPPYPLLLGTYRHMN